MQEWDSLKDLEFSSPYPGPFKIDQYQHIGHSKRGFQLFICSRSVTGPHLVIKLTQQRQKVQFFIFSGDMSPSLLKGWQRDFAAYLMRFFHNKMFNIEKSPYQKLEESNIKSRTVVNSRSLKITTKRGRLQIAQFAMLRPPRCIQIMHFNDVKCKIDRSYRLSRDVITSKLKT